MRFADLLGDPDDDGTAPGTPPRAEPGVAASGAAAGASGSLGGTGTADDELARWFDPAEDEAAGPEDPAVVRPTRTTAIADATGAYEAATADRVAPIPEPIPDAARPGVTRDDLLPARAGSRGRRRR